MSQTVLATGTVPAGNALGTRSEQRIIETIRWQDDLRKPHHLDRFRH